jgi:4-hydroxybenzoate polyprenyltransferase
MKPLPGYNWLIRLIRLPNLAIIALTMVLVQWFILLPVFPVKPAHWYVYFLISLTYTLLIAAAGYIFNDIRDQKIDLINKPQKTVVGIFISQTAATRLYFILTLTGIALAVYLSFLIYSAVPFVIALTAVLSLYGYAAQWKKSFLTGNLVVSFLCMLTLLQPWLLWAYGQSDQLRFPKSVQGQMALTYLWLYALLAFLSTLFRELAKDVQDMEGDRRYGCRTVPIVWGIKKTKKGMMVVATVLLLVSGNLIWLQWLEFNWLFIIIFLIINTLPFSITLYKLGSAQQPEDFKNLNYLALYHILSGTLTMLLLKI